MIYRHEVLTNKNQQHTYQIKIIKVLDFMQQFAFSLVNIMRIKWFLWIYQKYRTWIKRKYFGLLN